MSKPLPLLLLLCALIQPAAAQRVPPALFARMPGDDPDNPDRRPLRLAEVRIDVQILGHFAETHMEMTFANPHDRVLVGDLYVPLPAGATVSGYALDINGRMVEGVAVERTKGRIVFERIVRRGIDPGLIEWVKGNCFKTSVFPLPARGTRRIRVSYVSELLGTPDGEAYRLPLNFTPKVGRFALRVEVIRPVEPPKIAKGKFADFRFKRLRDGFLAETTLEDVALTEDLTIALPKRDRPRVVVERTPDGQYYFAVHDEPVDPRPPARGPVPPPKHVTIFWDASASRGERKHEQALKLLRTYFGRFGAATITVDLVVFRNEAEKPRSFTITNGKTAELIAAIRAVKCDGGTRLGCIAPAAGAAPSEVYLLFSDGHSSLGGEIPAGFAAPLYAVSDDPKANHGLLGRIASASGGRCVQFDRRTLADAAGAIGRRALLYLGATVEPRRVSGLLPAGVRPVADRFTLVGRLDAERAEVTLRYGSGGRVLTRRKCVLRRADAAAGSLLRRIWAQRKLAELCLFSRRNREQILALGRQFAMVTPFTSLIVLDSVDQYIEHRIRPPASLPRMRQQYDGRVLAEAARARQQRDAAVQRVLGPWRDRLRWYKTDFQVAAAQPAPRPTSAQAPADRADQALQRLARGAAELRAKLVAARGNDVNAGKLAESAARLQKQLVQAAATLRTELARQMELASVLRDERGNLIREIGGYQFRIERLNRQIRDLNDVNRGLRERLVASAATGAARQETYVRSYDIRDLLVPTEQARIKRELGLSADEDDDGLFGDDDDGGGDLFGDDDDDAGRGRRPRPRRRAPAPRAPAPDAPPPTPEPPVIRVKAWNPHMPYLKQLERAAPADRPAVYMRLRRRYGQSPAFFLDCADFFFRRGNGRFAMRVLSNVPELELDSAALLRVTAFQFLQAGRLEEATALFEEVLRLQPDQPRARRDLALVLAGRRQYARAIRLLYEAVLASSNRLGELEPIALTELNRLIARARAAGVKDIPVDPRLISALEMDLRIVLTWDTDGTDIDLWITEPGGEKVSYERRRSRGGGQLSRDVTEGFGPEEYVLRRAAPGRYRIEAHYFATHIAKLTGPTTAKVDIFTNYGRPNETHRVVTVRLARPNDRLLIGEVDIAPETGRTP